MEMILKARGKWDDKTVTNRKRQIRFGFVTALLGPFAVLCLSLQILKFQEPNKYAIGLILLELLALLATLLLGLWQIGRSHHNSFHKWIEYRVRTEVLRREQFLLQARVGPYLTEHDPGNAVRRRLEVIDNREDPMELILLQYPEGKPWRDELEDRGPGNTAPPHPNLLGCLKIYLDDRLRDQRNWFRDSSASHAERNKWLENGAKLTLALALVVAAMHLILLVRPPPQKAHSDRQLSIERPQISAYSDGIDAKKHSGSLDHLLIGIFAIVLPPVGSALIALQSLYESRRLSLSYQGHADVLTSLANDGLALQMEIEEVFPSGIGDSLTDQERAKKAQFELRLKRLILRTEELLASELRHWWLVVSGGGDFL